MRLFSQQPLTAWHNLAHDAITVCGGHCATSHCNLSAALHVLLLLCLHVAFHHKQALLLGLASATTTTLNAAMHGAPAAWESLLQPLSTSRVSQAHYVGTCGHHRSICDGQHIERRHNKTLPTQACTLHIKPWFSSCSPCSEATFCKQHTRTAVGIQACETSLRIYFTICWTHAT